MDADPVASGIGGVPLDAVGVWGLGEESKEGLLVLSRLGVDSESTQLQNQMEEDENKRRHSVWCVYVSSPWSLN